MRRDDALMLDIVLASRRILGFTKNMSRDQFDADEIGQSAVIHQLTVIGKAASHLSEELLETLNDIPWPQIVEYWNQLAHGYFQVDLDKVWSVVKNDLEPLVERLLPFIPPDEDDE